MRSCLKQVATSIVDSSASANELDLCVLDENRSRELAFDARSLTVQCCQNVFPSKSPVGLLDHGRTQRRKNLLKFTGRVVTFEEN